MQDRDRQAEDGHSIKSNKHHCSIVPTESAVEAADQKASRKLLHYDSPKREKENCVRLRLFYARIETSTTSFMESTVAKDMKVFRHFIAGQDRRAIVNAQESLIEDKTAINCYNYCI